MEIEGPGRLARSRDGEMPEGRDSAGGGRGRKVGEEGGPVSGREEEESEKGGLGRRAEPEKGKTGSGEPGRRARTSTSISLPGTSRVLAVPGVAVAVGTDSATLPRAELLVLLISLRKDSATLSCAAFLLFLFSLGENSLTLPRVMLSLLLLLVSLLPKLSFLLGPDRRPLTGLRVGTISRSAATVADGECPDLSPFGPGNDVISAPPACCRVPNSASTGNDEICGGEIIDGIIPDTAGLRLRSGSLSSALHRTRAGHWGISCKFGLFLQ